MSKKGIDLKIIKNGFAELWNDIRKIRISLILLAGYFVLTQMLFEASCPFAILTGLACPACGLTRAGWLVLRGGFAEALQINPAIFLWIPLIFYAILQRYYLKKIKPFLPAVVAIVCFFTLLLYLVRLLHGDLISVKPEGIFPLRQQIEGILQYFNH